MRIRLLHSLPIPEQHDQRHGHTDNKEALHHATPVEEIFVASFIHGLVHVIRVEVLFFVVLAIVFEEVGNPFRERPVLLFGCGIC